MIWGERLRLEWEDVYLLNLLLERGSIPLRDVLQWWLRGIGWCYDARLGELVEMSEEEYQQQLREWEAGYEEAEAQ